MEFGAIFLVKSPWEIMIDGLCRAECKVRLEIRNFRDLVDLVDRLARRCRGSKDVGQGFKQDPEQDFRLVQNSGKALVLVGRYGVYSAGRGKLAPQSLDSCTKGDRGLLSLVNCFGDTLWCILGPLRLDLRRAWRDSHHC